MRRLSQFVVLAAVTAALSGSVSLAEGGAAETPAANDEASTTPELVDPDSASAATSEAAPEAAPVAAPAATAAEAETPAAEAEMTVTQAETAATAQAQAAPAADAAALGSQITTAEAEKTRPAPEAGFPGVDGAAGKPDAIADGERVTVKDGDFSLTPPRGWEVYTTLPSLTMLMQIPHQPGMKYQRTIQVASFAGPRYIDEVTAKEYEDVIVRKFSAATASIEGYRIRNHLNIEMADGRDGLLFYTEFTLEGVNLMQAHILVSSSNRHYLMTYTDVAEHFENDAANQFLTEAWDSMISVQLGHRTPSRFASMYQLGIAIGILLLLGLVTMFVRRWHAAKAYRDYTDERSLSDVELSNAPQSLPATTAGFSKMPSNVSELSGVSRLEDQKAKTKQVSGKSTAAASTVTSMPAESLDEEPFDDDIAV